VDVGGEGVQFGLVVGFDVAEPAGEVFAAGASGHHLGEAGDMLGEAVGLGAVAAQFGEQLLRSPCPLVLVWPQNGAVMLMQPRPWPDVPGLTSRAGAKMIRSQPPPSMSCLPALLAELLVVGIIGASLRRGS
jgi:hypothetical protein